MKILELNGQWELRDADGESLCPVEVPGSVISGLYAAGKMEHPYYRENEYAARELFWKDYQFVRSFVVAEALLANREVTLVCEGLDTLAQIFVNGKELACTDNMHRTYRFAVKEFLHLGRNEICIVFHSVLRFIENYPYQENKTIQYVPCGAMKGNQLVRKAHSMFGWDWGPQLVDAGIWRAIYIEGTDSFGIEDVRIRQVHEKDGSVRIRTTITLSGDVDALEDRAAGKTPDKGALGQADAPGTAPDKVLSGQADTAATSPDHVPSAKDGIIVTVTLAEKNDKQVPEITAEAAAGREEGAKLNMVYGAEMTVQQPKLWWPNGYGEQPLYELTVSVDWNGRHVQRVTKTIGLRTLTVSQEADAWGNEFAFMINGVKIFTKGGNYIPEDAVYPWIDEKRIEYLLKCCVRANFNCVRVWGGGYYPSDTFYDLCDQYGLIVWQDLMYACNVYDVTDDFASTVRQETIDNVRRIRHHASLGLWCGNNEIESAWHHWGDFQQESMYLRADYIKLFEEILPRAVREADDVTFYWRSSPSSGGCFDDPDSDRRGDVHYWDVWHGQKPFSDYQKYFFRFCSEFGFQSFPCLKTVESFTEETDRNIFSKVMESHQKNDSANGKMLYYLSENFRYPKDFKSLLYVTQVLQGMAIKSGVDHWRRNRGRCMGTLYWQVNDNWPVASWAGIDYYGRWKALHYMAAKFYAPVAVSIQKTEDFVSVYLANETLEKQQCSVSLRVRDMEFHVIAEWKNEVRAEALCACELLQCEMGDMPFYRTDRDFADRMAGDNCRLFLEAEVTLSDGTVLTDVDTFVPYKHIELPKPHFVTAVNETKHGFEITVRSDVFAPFVEMDFADADVIFSDNFFTISSENPVTVRLEKCDILRGSFADAADLDARLVLTSVAGTY
ncbi:MAG: glycoside hydrolase family 2 protein [Lachnospiraceae bacterium]|nr:glycoside hydrolase family 2 protein [Lachnospiraceae bacterium]